jgi:phosphatidylserine decarboxylase
MGFKLPVAREGWPFIAGPAAVAALLALLGRRRLALPFAAAAVASLGFFRDPERATPVGGGTALAPADGRVTAVEEVEDSFVGPAVRVSIFLSPLDVHVNRTPVEGQVTRVEYHPGRFLPAYRAEAGQFNEWTEVWFEQNGRLVVCRQIVGILARRIVCRLAPGDRVARGQRFGIMKFGSRIDLFLPPGARITARPGDRVVGGETTLALLET